ncbi:hypothetical protein T552_03210 [Pneumocystis carinii B80]|uniref:Uncharacterized protein n=1 Tax=Pneumocystis carinii (strain B80) TaxID=1408658 RepID=A0A0W4ZC05_PNEC8|nr:hypothetical protein T552_03210 [Pneumocystis carinii B80]KTW25936.1 hypothetical protein T552_03210 [Pneumocystis carinii B80]
MKKEQIINENKDLKCIPKNPVEKDNIKPFIRKKRIPHVLEEDVYQEALSDIIRRDFFPDLHEEYSNEMVSSLCKKGLSLDEFQATYTSEDNASFSDILERQNERQREAYRWVWDNRNKIDSDRVKEEERRRIMAGNNIGNIEGRPAQPEAWPFNPMNALMFTPETDYTKAKSLPLEAEKSIVYHATRMPLERQEYVASPSVSAIDKEPEVAGWTFVDEAPTPSPKVLKKSRKLSKGMGSESESIGTPGTPGRGFKMPDIPAREILHHRITEEIKKKKRAKTPAAFLKEIPKFSSSPDLRKVMLSPGGRLLLAATQRHASAIRNDLKTPRMSLLNNETTDITPRAT